MNRNIGPYVLDKHLSSGNFGKVYVGTHEPSNEKVAIKIVTKNAHSINSSKEYDIMMKLHHPFIVSLYEVIEDSENLYIIMEYVEGPTLLEYIKEQGKLPDWKIKHIFCEILSAVLYLHKTLKIVHRDLKLENIIIDKNLNVRLLDFGLSNQQKHDTALFKTTCGSPSYSAPELLMGKPYNHKVDMWSLGIILYALTFNTLPFGDPNMQGLTSKIITKDPFYPMTSNQQIVTVIKTLLNKDPDKRPSSEEAVELPWVASYQNVFILRDPFNKTERWSANSNDSYVGTKIMMRKQIDKECADFCKSVGDFNAFKFNSTYNHSRMRNHLITNQKMPIRGSTFQKGAKRLIMAGASPKMVRKFD